MFNLSKNVRQYHSPLSVCKSAGNPLLKVELEGRLQSFHRCRAVRVALMEIPVQVQTVGVEGNHVLYYLHISDFKLQFFEVK